MGVKTITRRFTDEMARRLKPVSLDDGGHQAPAVRPKVAENGNDHGLCVMEAVAYVTGQPHSERPMCVSQTITSFLIEVNDSIRDTTERNKLKRVIPKIIGTRPLVPARVRGTALRHDGVPVLRPVRETEHKGYAYAEKRRKALRDKELAVIDVDGFESERDTDDLSAKEAIAIVEKMAAIPNRAPAKKRKRR